MQVTPAKCEWLGIYDNVIWEYSFRNNILTFWDRGSCFVHIYFTFTKEILKENITSCSVSVNKTFLCLELATPWKEKLLPKYHIFERFWLSFWYMSLLLFNPFLHKVVPKRLTYLSKPAIFTLGLMIVSLCDIDFMYDHRYYNA